MKTVTASKRSGGSRALIRGLGVVALVLVVSFPRIASGAEGVPGGRVEIDRERVDGRVSRFGEAAADVAIIETALRQVANNTFSLEDRAAADAAAERIARIPLEGRGIAERRQLANAWGRIAGLTHAHEGPSARYLECLEIASNLDPENETLRKEIDLQRTRKALAARRVAEAERVRTVRAAGQEPFKDLPPIDGLFRAPSARVQP